MGPKCLSRGKYLIPVVLLAFFLIGCSRENETGYAEGKSNSWTNKLFSRGPNPELSPSGNQQAGTYPIDPLFRAFYLTLGGEDTLGPAISLATSEEDQTRQFLESGLMIFDPQAADSSRFTLAPLGLELGMGEGILRGSKIDSGRVINGYLVNAEFLDLYERLGGSRFVGRPISEAHHNTAKRRVEQYFENLGFYQLDSETKIRLMPYGAYACDRNCRFQEPTAAIPGRQPILPEAFLEKTLELGLPFVGKPLTGLHLAPDGSQEIIFENLVLVAEAETPNDVTVRPIANTVGDHAQSPASPQNSTLSVFIEVEAGLGFNVPLYFVEYLNLFGGMGVAGQPVSEVFSPEPGVYWQCFTNLCLQFNLNVEGDQRLRPVPLGAVYKAESYDNVRDYEANQTLENLNIKVWEKGTFVSANESQEIHVALFENNKPLKNYEPILVVTMPDGSQRKAYFMPSDENGRTSLKLSPIDAPNGTLIAYRICLLGITEIPRCVGDNYLIWNAD